MLTNTYECLAIILRSLRLVANCIRKPIRLIFATFWRICREYIFLHSQGYSPQCESSIMFFFYDKLVVYMCIYTFTMACMYSLHVYSRVHCMFSVHASTNICASSTTTDDRCSINCFHTSIHAHTHHHVHRTVYSLLLIVHLLFDILLLLMPR